MKFGQTIIFMLLAVSFPDLAQAAFPIVPMNDINGQNCLYTSEQKTFAELIHKVNVIGRDDRGPLTTMGPAIGLSQEEIQQIRQTTGYVYCPGTKYHNAATGSAALISNGQIITAAHAFYDEQGRKREPWSACYFEAQSGKHMTKIHFSWGDGKVIFGSHNPLGSIAESRRDIAVLTLKSRVAGVKPFALGSKPIAKGEKIFGITAVQAGFQKDWREPIVETCRPQQLFPAYADTPSGYYSNCDLNHGSSGGINLVRRNGKLVIVGIYGYGGDAKDGSAYDPSNDSYAYSIGVDGNLAKVAASMAGVNVDDDSPSQGRSGDSSNI